MSPKHLKSYGYNRLETDDEIVIRLRQDGTLRKIRSKYIDESIDAWLEVHGLAKKLIYIP